jgi:signal transduction histidine kinase
MTRSRGILTAVLFTLTLLVGASLTLFHVPIPSVETPPWSALREIFEYNQKPDNHHGSASTVVNEIRTRFPYWVDSKAWNKDLILNATLAALAVLATLCTIAAVSKKQADPKDSLLESLKQDKEKAENLAKLKADFLNHVSHELRTPLAVIIGYIECITDGLYGQIGSKHQEILEIVAKQSTQLKDMIDQILIYSRLDSNRQTVRTKDFRLEEIINEIQNTFNFLCDQRGIALLWEVPNQEISLSTDSERLKEILSNLLQNAIKYTDRGSITVRALAERQGDKIRFEIADTGLGIPQNYIATIFEPFIQVHRSSTEMSRGGIGLGLSIVKKHVEQLRGGISVASELGRGSTFTVTIPRVFEKQTSRGKQLMSLVKFAYPQGRRNQPVAHRQNSADAPTGTGL